MTHTWSKSRGQALTETLIGAVLLVPLLYAVLFLADLLHLQHHSIATTRQALMLAHHAEGQVNDDVLQDWFQARTASAPPAAPWALQVGSVDIQIAAAAQVESAERLEKPSFDIVTAAQLYSESTFGLARNAARVVSVETRWQLPAFLVADGTTNTLIMKERLFGLHDTWASSGTPETEQHTYALSVQRQLRALAEPLKPVRAALSVVEPAFDRLCFGRLAVDIVPPDRTPGTTPQDMRRQGC